MKSVSAEDSELINDLYLRLRALDPKTFERLCFHLIRERHPGVDIKAVDGAAGDEGVDAFTNGLDGGPVIWQCKSFPDGVKESQKKQIRSSLRRAASIHPMNMWILCLSTDMDIRAHRWFERLKQSYSGRLKVGLLPASIIVSELIHRKTLLEAFFPGVLLNAQTLRGLMTMTDGLSDEGLADLTGENVGQYIQRLKDRDARFNYEIRFSTDLGTRVRVPEPGLIASLTRGSKTVDVFARDIEALRLNPPKLRFSVVGAGIEKMNALLKTGRAQEFGPGEIVDVMSDLSFTQEAIQPEWMRVGPVLKAERIPLRVTFGCGPEAITYDLIEFEVARTGSEEVELVSCGNLPFHLTIVLKNQEGTAKICIAPDFVGWEIDSVQRIFSAAEQVRSSGSFELYDVRQGKAFLHASVNGWLGWDDRLRQLIDDLVVVARYFRATIRVPREVTESDAESLALLKGIATGEAVLSGDFSCELINPREINPSFEEVLSGIGVPVRLTNLRYAPVLFGEPISTGLVVVEAEHATLKGPAGRAGGDRQDASGRSNGASVLRRPHTRKALGVSAGGG